MNGLTPSTMLRRSPPCCWAARVILRNQETSSAISNPKGISTPPIGNGTTGDGVLGFEIIQMATISECRYRWLRLPATKPRVDQAQSFLSRSPAGERRTSQARAFCNHETGQLRSRSTAASQSSLHRRRNSRHATAVRRYGCLGREVHSCAGGRYQTVNAIA